jgi:hypothetical protein
MCYYNGQKVTKAEFIQLMQLEKAVKDYEFLNRDVTHAFEFGNIAVLKPRYTRDNFDIVQMEWSFLPKYVKNRAQVEKFRKGYKKKMEPSRLVMTPRMQKEESFCSLIKFTGKLPWSVDALYYLRASTNGDMSTELTNELAKRKKRLINILIILALKTNPTFM